MFRPSRQLARPHAMVGMNVIVADTDAQAARLFTSLQLRFLGMQRGERGPLPRPVDSLDGIANEMERAGVMRALSMSAVGSPATVARRLEEMAEATVADEFIVATAVHDHAARLRSYELLAESASPSRGRGPGEGAARRKAPSSPANAAPSPQPSPARGRGAASADPAPRVVEHPHPRARRRDIPAVQLICTLRNTRSGCGISAVKRPSAVVTAVRPSGLPFGLNG